MFIKKNRILLTVLIATLLSVVAVMVVFATAQQTTVYNNTTSTTLFSGGKSSITLDIDSSKLEDGLREEAAFVAYFQGYLDAINKKSGDTDFVILDRCETTQQGFRVTVSTRRIDKLQGIGEFVYSEVEKLLPADEESLQNYARGTVKMRIRRVYPGTDAEEKLFYIGYSDFSKAQELTISPLNADSGKQVSFGDFASDLTGGGRKLVIDNAI